MVLSRPILVSKYSNYLEVHRFISTKFNKALEDFNIDNLEDYSLILKHRKVRFDMNQVKRKFKNN